MQFITILAHLSYMKHLIFVCRYVEPFRSFMLPIDGSARKLKFFRRQILGVGEKKSKVGDQPWHHPYIMCKFRGDPLRNGRDPLSRKSGPKEINKVLLQNI